MTVSLTKGGNVSLTRQAPNLERVAFGLGWEARTTTGVNFDLDASAFLIGGSGRVLSDSHFVFFNNLDSPDRSVHHWGEELVGGTENEDDETIDVTLGAVPSECIRIAFAVSIYEAEQRSQNFGQVTNAYIRVFDMSDGAELARYDLSEDASLETAMVFGELYRDGSEWKFTAVGRETWPGSRGSPAASA